MNLKFRNTKTFCLVLATFMISCSPAIEYYTVKEFEKVPKIDAHFHYLTFDQRYMELASTLNFRLLSPNWDWENTIDEQMKISVSILKAFPGKYAFFGTFSVDSFNNQDFFMRSFSHERN